MFFCTSPFHWWSMFTTLLILITITITNNTSAVQFRDVSAVETRRVTNDVIQVFVRIFFMSLFVMFCLL